VSSREHGHRRHRLRNRTEHPGWRLPRGPHPDRRPDLPGQLRWGDSVEVTVLRDGRERTVEVELGGTEAG